MIHALKALALLLALLIPAAAFAAAPTLSVRAVDTRTILATYENLMGGTYEIIAPSKEVVRDGNLPKGSGSKRIQLPKNSTPGTYTFVAKDKAGKEIARASFAITYNAPTCRASFSKKQAQTGDFVTLRWKSENADKAFVFGKTYAASGAEKIALHHAGARVFAVNVIGKGGVGSCRAEVTVK